MAKIYLAGDAVVITSALSLESIRTVKKYRPEALNLYGGKENEVLIFSILVDRGSGVGANAIAFNAATRDEAKLATLTTMLPESAKNTDVKEYLADEYGAVITNLNKIEAAIPAVLEEITAEKAAVMSNISIYGQE